MFSSGRFIVHINPSVCPDPLPNSSPSATAMASALYHYMRYYCNMQVTWGINGTGSQLQLPSPLPKVSTPVRQVKTVPYT